MVKALATYPNFSSGEISPKLYGRIDLAAYYSGSRRMENFIPQVTGSAHFRTGTVFASKTRDNVKAYITTFRFTDNASFILELTPSYIRFYQNNGLVTEDSQDVTNITNSNPAVVTYSGVDNYSNGDRVILSNVTGMTDVNNVEYEVANVNTGANTFELLGIDSTSYGAYVSGGQAATVVEVSTPYTADELYDLRFAQNGIDLYIVHPNHNPKKLTYASATSWSIANHSPTGLTLSAGNYPTAVTFYEQRLIYGGTDNNPQTLYFSKSGDVDNFTTGTAVDDGIEYTVSGGGKIIWLRGTDRFLTIGSLDDILKATGGIDDVITPESISIKPTNSYGVSSINPIGKGSQIFYMQENNLIMRSLEFDFTQDAFFPADRNTIAEHITRTGVVDITFQEGRPNIVWGVRTDGVLIGMTVEDAESISGWHKHITQGEFQSVATLPRSNNYEQLWACVKRDNDYFIEYLSEDVNFVRREDYITASKADDEALYGRLIFEQQREYIYTDSTLSYYGDDLFTETLTLGAVSGATTLTASGAVFTSSDVGKNIWRKSATGNEFGVCEIIAYNSSTSVDVQVNEEFSGVSIPSGEWFITTDTVTGLEHLEGKTVSIVTDGGQHPQKSVTNGAVTLDRQHAVVHVGLGYTGYIETNDIEAGGVNGTSQSQKKSLTAVGFRFLDSLFAQYGTDYYTLEQLNERTPSMLMDRPPLPFTGDRKRQHLNKVSSDRDGGWKREKRAIIAQNQPFPCKIQLLIPYINTSNI